jgi:hypothetical protein
MLKKKDLEQKQPPPIQIPQGVQIRGFFSSLGVTSTEKGHIKAGLGSGYTEFKTPRKHYLVTEQKPDRFLVSVFDLPLKNKAGSVVATAKEAFPSKKVEVFLKSDDDVMLSLADAIIHSKRN